MLAGYRDRISVAAGEAVGFYVHSDIARTCDVELVRVLYGGTHPDSPGPLFEPVASDLPRQYDASPQSLVAGSFARVAAVSEVSSGLEDFSFACAAFPTARRDRDQTIVSFADGVKLVLAEDFHVSICVGDEVLLRLDEPLARDRWACVGFSYDAAGQRLEVFQRPIEPAVNDAFRSQTMRTGDRVRVDGLKAGGLVLAAELILDGRGKQRPRNCFNGRLEAPRLYSSALTATELFEAVVAEGDSACSHPSAVGAWDFSIGISTRRIYDVSAMGLHLEVVNLPNRGVRGIHWDGTAWDWTQRPEHYGAIHFHDDDIYDADWELAFSWSVPTDTLSGLYAVRLTRGDEIHYICFFVTAAGAPRRRKLAFVASTATYLAYANEQARALMGSLSNPGKGDISLQEQQLASHPSFGRSQYELHADHSGIHYSSYLRPVLTWQPGTPMWSLNADTALLHWLEVHGIEFDLVTDHDLHNDVDLLCAYQCVMTGSHPEYLSERMRNAYERFMDRGGRLMYMGGNGFYWRVAMSEAWPAAIEVRRCEASTRAWMAEPGEYYHAFDGSYGGLWRNQGRAPNRLVGIGFAAQGFGDSMPYHKTEEAEHPRAQFIFDGVDEDTFGDFGTLGGGAAGEEIDRFDRSLGSPTHALVVAKTKRPPADMLRVVEEFSSSLPPFADRRIRADMTFFETAAGGAVFSTGSIAWAGALCHNSYDNSVARITANVVARFLDEAPFTFLMDRSSDGSL